jgi:hypothetical protein
MAHIVIYPVCVINKTGFGDDNRIYKHLLVQSVAITINYTDSQKSLAETFFLDCLGLNQF